MLPYGSIFSFIILPNGSMSQQYFVTIRFVKRRLMYFKRIEDLRVDNDYTQEQVAGYLNIAREVYRRYEKGTRSIPVDCLIELSKLYDISTDYILGLTDNKRKYPPPYIKI